MEIKSDYNTLFFNLEDTNINKIIVGEDYYTYNTCYKDTYNISKSDDGRFELQIKKGNIRGKHAIYYIKYNLNDEGVFVFKANFI